MLAWAAPPSRSPNGLSMLVGVWMVHADHGLALSYDRLVGQAASESPIRKQLQRGNSFTAAGLDATGNSVAGLLGLLGGYAFPWDTAPALSAAESVR